MFLLWVHVPGELPWKVGWSARWNNSMTQKSAITLNLLTQILILDSKRCVHLMKFKRKLACVQPFLTPRASLSTPTHFPRESSRGAWVLTLGLYMFGFSTAVHRHRNEYILYSSKTSQSNHHLLLASHHQHTLLWYTTENVKRIIIS